MIRVVALVLFICWESAASGDKIAELFSQIENDATYREQSEVINNEYNSVLCWLETINLVEYRNGTRSIDRQFSIILETPGDLSNNSLARGEASNLDMPKSAILNFTTLHNTKYFTVKVNKTLRCGVGQVLVKEFFHSPSDKKRIQLNLGSSKMLDMHQLKSEIRGIVGSSKWNKGKTSRPKRTRDQSATKGNGNPNDKKQTTNESDSHEVNEPKKKIFRSAEETTSADYRVIPGRNQLNASSPCDVKHKLSIRIQIYVEHTVVDRNSGAVLRRAPLTNVAKNQDINVKSRPTSKSGVCVEEVNKSWKRLARQLSRGYSVEYLEKILPFSDLPLTKANSTISTEEEFIIFDEATSQELNIIQKYMEECEG